METHFPLRCLLTFPVDVVDEGSQSNLDEVWSVTQVLQRKQESAVNAEEREVLQRCPLQAESSNCSQKTLLQTLFLLLESLHLISVTQSDINEGCLCLIKSSP